MPNTLKINDFKKSALFCKYLCNESSDLYENVFISSKIVKDNPKNCGEFKHSWVACTRHNCVCACFLMHVHVYEECLPVCPWIFTKFSLVVHHLSYELKQKISWKSEVLLQIYLQNNQTFCIFSQLCMSPKCWMILEFLRNNISKCPNLIDKRTPVPFY